MANNYPACVPRLCAPWQCRVATGLASVAVHAGGMMPVGAGVYRAMVLVAVGGVAVADAVRTAVEEGPFFLWKPFML